MHPLDEELARRVCVRVADRRIRLFDELGIYKYNDVVSEGLLAIVKGWKSFDPAKSQRSTFMYALADRRVLDLLKSIKSSREREKKASKPELFIQTSEDLVSWLADVYKRACQGFADQGVPVVEPGRQYHGRRPLCTRPQAVALLALRRRENLSLREVARLIRTRPDLRVVIGFHGLPSYKLFHRLEKSVTKLKISMSAGRRRAASNNRA